MIFKIRWFEEMAQRMFSKQMPKKGKSKKFHKEVFVKKKNAPQRVIVLNSSC